MLINRKKRTAELGLSPGRGASPHPWSKYQWSFKGGPRSCVASFLFWEPLVNVTGRRIETRGGRSRAEIFARWLAGRLSDAYPNRAEAREASRRGGSGRPRFARWRGRGDGGGRTRPRYANKARHGGPPDRPEMYGPVLPSCRLPRDRGDTSLAQICVLWAFGPHQKRNKKNRVPVGSPPARPAAKGSVTEGSRIARRPGCHPARPPRFRASQPGSFDLSVDGITGGGHYYQPESNCNHHLPAATLAGVSFLVQGRRAAAALGVQYATRAAEFRLFSRTGYVMAVPFIHRSWGASQEIIRGILATRVCGVKQLVSW